MGDPTPAEYRKLMELVAKNMGFAVAPQAADHLLAFYERTGRNLRRCHPRDLLNQVANYCKYRKMPLTIRPDFLDQACRSYFSEL